MIELTDSVKLFREKLSELSREELLDLIKRQDPDLVKQVNRIEYVFEKKLTHLTWDDGTPIEGRLFTNEELIRLIDPPFIHSPKLEKHGFTADMQRQILIASDPVLWAKHFLGAKPRAYQILVMRDLNSRRVLRWGRRLGKSFTFAMYLLWFCFTQNDVHAIVVAPMKSMVDLIFKEVMKLAESNTASPLVKDAIHRSVMSPQAEINFTNGSLIRFFTTGMKNNSKSNSTRGQEAHLIIADEMDYMGPEDLVALMAMLQNTSDTYTNEKILMGASTPSGQRGMFYDWNTRPEYGFSAYWFPSNCNPFWDKKTEALMRQQYPNPNHYRQEIEADWGVPAEGVYPRQAVDLCFWHDRYDDNGKLIEQRTWDYSKPVLMSARSEFVFGVDWDKYQAGVNIVVLEVCHDNYEDQRFAGKIKIAYREEIDKGEFTYSESVERLEKLSQIFRPKFIYVDRGSGEVQIELLHKRGLQAPETRLHQIVKGYQFSETIEVRDPFTQEKVKKRLKHFMVDNLYRMFQEQRIVASATDEELYEQIIGYIVVRENSNHEPIFGPGPSTVDHAHDALLLAAYAVSDNYDELLNPVFASRAKTVSNKTFLPLLNLDTQDDKELKEALDDAGVEAPIYTRRAMSRNLRGGNATGRSSFGNSRRIKRRMF